MSDFEQLARYVALQGRVVADIGCGDGAFVRALSAAGATAIGVDVDVTRARAIDPEHRYLEGGAEAIPLPDASVDVATLMRSLHHVPDPRHAFPELARVVRQHVWIAEPLPEGEFFELLRPVDDETAVRANAQAAIAETTHFTRVQTIEYAVTLAIPSFDDLRARVLAADPARQGRFDELEAALRERFTPGDYAVPMRADLLMASPARA